MNTLTTYQNDIVAELEANAWLHEHDVSIIAENSLEIETQIQTALDTTGILATVNTPAITGIGDYGDQIIGEIETLTIVVLETVALNRERPNGCTALDAGVQIATLLHDETRRFLTLEQSVDEQAGTIVCTVRLSTSIPVAVTLTPEN